MYGGEKRFESIFYAVYDHVHLELFQFRLSSEICKGSNFAYLEGRQCVEFYGHPMTSIYNVLISELNYCEEVGSLNPVRGKPKVRLWYFWSR